MVKGELGEKICTPQEHTQLMLHTTATLPSRRLPSPLPGQHKHHTTSSSPIQREGKFAIPGSTDKVQALGDSRDIMPPARTSSKPHNTRREQHTAEGRSRHRTTHAHHDIHRNDDDDFE